MRGVELAVGLGVDGAHVVADVPRRNDEDALVPQRPEAAGEREGSCLRDRSSLSCLFAARTIFGPALDGLLTQGLLVSPPFVGARSSAYERGIERIDRPRRHGGRAIVGAVQLALIHTARTGHAATLYVRRPGTLDPRSSKSVSFLTERACTTPKNSRSWHAPPRIHLLYALEEVLKCHFISDDHCGACPFFS